MREWKKRNWVQQVQKTQGILQRIKRKCGDAWMAKCGRDYFLKTRGIATALYANGNDLVEWRKIIMQERSRTAGAVQCLE